MKRIKDAPPEWGQYGYVELDDGRQLRIESDENTRSPMDAKNGNAIHWQSVRTLALSNGDVVYGCTDCEYVAISHRSVRPHRNAHRGDRVKALADGEGDALDGLRAVLRKAEKVQQLVEERDRYKERALKAERELSGLRQMMQKVLGS